MQGVCETRELDNISVKTSPEYGRGNTDYFVAANSALPSMTTVAFVGAGPSPRHSSVLYVGTTYTGTTPTSVRQTVPAVSSRSLNAGPGLLRFTHVDGLTGGTLVRLRSEAIEKLPLTYVAGFSASGFAHFLTVQPERFALENFGAPPTVSSKFSSRLVRVCQRDRGFYSYVEMPIRCTGDVGYNLVRAATVVQPSADLAARLLLTSKESGDEQKVVVAVFSRSLGDGDTPSSESAVCLYRLVDVQRKFVDNVRQCFSGQQTRVGSQFGNRMCVSLVSFMRFCLRITRLTCLAINVTRVTAEALRDIIVIIFCDEPSSLLFDGQCHRCVISLRCVYNVVYDMLLFINFDSCFVNFYMRVSEAAFVSLVLIANK